LAGERNPFSNGFRMLFRAVARNIAIFHSGHFDVQIDPIEQGTGNSLTITLHLHWTAAAFAFQIAEKSTRAGVHRRDQHEFARESQTAGRPRDCYFSVFEWLAHDLERGPFEFRQLVQEQHTVVGEADFARSWKRTSAEQSNVADGVMRRTKRSCRNERSFAVKESGDAVDLGGLDRFIERHRRNDGGYSLGQH